MNWDDTLWTAMRIFDCLGAVVAAVLLYRKLKRQLLRGDIKNERDAELRVALTLYLIGTGVLFGRALVLGSPGGVHLLLIALPLIWILKPLIKSEIVHRRDTH
jgi:hypothetical protein